MDFDTPEHVELRRICKEQGHDWRAQDTGPILNGGLTVCARCGKYEPGGPPKTEASNSCPQ